MRSAWPVDVGTRPLHGFRQQIDPRDEPGAEGRVAGIVDDPAQCAVQRAVGSFLNRYSPQFRIT